ncbi:hypothetical protein [Halomonas sp. E19]|uniref:hypothetical protein n=1 Tax=Halomonas sp. E19 TaxID=3397247 RepID=UPI0040348655
MRYSQPQDPSHYQNRRLDVLAEPPEVGHELFVGLSALRDTLSSRHHSRDFAFAHARYLRSRVLALGLILRCCRRCGSWSTPWCCLQSCCATPWSAESC